MGLPIVATDIPGCREVVSNPDTALLVPRGDVPALTAALRNALEDMTGTGRRATAARARVRRDFSIDAVTERIWGVYQELGLT